MRNFFTQSATIPTRVIMVLELALLGFLVAASEIFQSDTFWLLRAGKELLAGKNVWRESWSYTAEGRYWPNHEWLYEVILYSAWASAGPWLALTLTAVAAMVTWKLLEVSRPADYVAVRFAVLLPLLLLIGLNGFVLRPQALSLLLFAVVIFLLVREKYIWLPLVMLVWANAHGTMIMGLVTIGTAFLLACAFHYKQRRPETKKRALVLFTVGVVSTLLTLCTPMGWRLWAYVAQSNNAAYGAVLEWVPLWKNPVASTLLLASFAFGGYYLWQARSRFTTWPMLISPAIAVVMLILTIDTSRIAPYLALALLLPLKESLTVGKTLSKPHRSKKSYIFTLAVIMTPIVLTSLVQQQREAQQFPKNFEAAVQACTGNVYNDYWSGGYLLWYMPDHKVFQDNRYDPYPRKIMEESKLQEDWRPFLKSYDVTCAIIAPRRNTDVGKFEDSRWRKIFDEKGWRLYEKPAS